MIHVEPTCRFCQRRLKMVGCKNDLNGYEEFIYWCQACLANQTFDARAKPLRWSFQVGRYELQFWPQDRQFAIFLLNERDLPILTINKCVLTLNFLPYLTPQNTTEERLKLFILFS
jgi:hypothetical protein